MNDYDKLSSDEMHKVEEIRRKRINFMNEQSRKWKTLKANEVRLAGYKKFQTLDGEGVRCSLYVSGCPFNCLDCYSPHAQNKNYGEILTDEKIEEILKDVSHPYNNGITFVGGEPMLSAERLYPIAKAVRDIGKTTWSYTGYTIEVLLDFPEDDPRRKFLNYLDVLIDGQFITELRDAKNPPLFRGSSNQRIIDVQETLKRKCLTLWKNNDIILSNVKE